LASGADTLGSAPTLSRFENAQNRAIAWAVNEELVEQFIRSMKKVAAYLVLDFDATDTPVHGQQEGKFFHGCYNCHCLVPLYVFYGDQLLVAYLRKSNIDAAKHAWAILKLLVKRLKAAWRRTKIAIRANSGFLPRPNAHLVRRERCEVRRRGRAQRAAPGSERRLDEEG